LTPPIYVHVNNYSYIHNTLCYVKNQEDLSEKVYTIKETILINTELQGYTITVDFMLFSLITGN